MFRYFFAAAFTNGHVQILSDYANGLHTHVLISTSCIIAYHASLRIVHPCSLLLISIVLVCAVCTICHVPLTDWSEVSTLVAPALRNFALNAAGEMMTSDGCTTRKIVCSSAGKALPASPMNCTMSAVR